MLMLTWVPTEYFSPWTLPAWPHPLGPKSQVLLIEIAQQPFEVKVVVITIISFSFYRWEKELSDLPDVTQ